MKKIIISISLIAMIIINLGSKLNLSIDSINHYISGNSTAETKSQDVTYSPSDTYIHYYLLNNSIAYDIDFSGKYENYLSTNSTELTLLEKYLDIPISDYFANIPEEKQDDYYYFIKLKASMASTSKFNLDGIVYNNNKLYFQTSYEETNAEKAKNIYNKITNQREICGGYIYNFCFVAAIPKKDISLPSDYNIIDARDKNWIHINESNFSEYTINDNKIS